MGGTKERLAYAESRTALTQFYFELEFSIARFHTLFYT